MSGMNKIQYLRNKIRDNLVPLVLVVLFLGYITTMFVFNMFHIGTVTDYLSVINVWTGYGRYLFILVLLCSFFKRDDDYLFWAVVIGFEYILQLMLTFVFCLQFTLGSFVLFADLAAYIFLYVSCPAVTAWLIGRVSRTVKNDVVSVVLFLASGSLFLFNIVQEILLFPIFGISEHTYTLISKAFIIFNNSLGTVFASPNTFAPFDVNITDVGTAVLWLGLFSLILGVVRKKKAMLLMAVPVLCSVFLITLPENKYEVYMNQSVLNADQKSSKMLDSWNTDKIYYQSRNLILEKREPVTAEMNFTGQRLEVTAGLKLFTAETDFTVEGYRLEITAGRKTKFTAVLQLSRADIDAYEFSLYHDYKVRRITDKDGAALSFSQEGDYITVFSGGKILDEITMEYEGTGLTYMASDDYTCLPEYYIYYPVAGKYILYDVWASNYVKNIFLPETEFSITVHADYEVYSNIEKKEYNTFEGTGTGPMLIGGKYLRACDDDGATVVYSVLTVNEQGAKEQYRHIMDFYKTHGVELDKTAWFVCPYYGGNYGRYYVGDGYMFGNYEELMVNMPLVYGMQSAEVVQ